MSRVAVTGGRDYANRRRMFEILDAAVPRLGLEVVITPRTIGAPSLARAWAAERKVMVEQVVFHWGRHHPEAIQRGNLYIIRELRPDVLLAFPGETETEDLAQQCQDAGIRVVRVDWSAEAGDG